MRSYGQYCGVALALDRVGDRWALLIVRELLLAPRRFTDLVAGLPSVATNLLTTRLAELEADGLVARHLRSGSRVYSLTPQGRALREVVESLARWGGQFMRSRSPELVFQLPWLCTALSAVCGPPPIPFGSRLSLSLRTPEGRSVLSLTSEGACLDEEPQPEPDVILHASVHAILGTATGGLDRSTSARLLRFEGARRSVQLVRRWLEPRRRRAA